MEKGNALRKKLDITVIVPVYNVENYLDRCVESLLRQTYRVEVILVDDGSTDDSGNICDKYASKYSNITVIHKENGGLSSARNIGIEAANSEYIGFVDSDDWITEDMYDYLHALIKKYGADIAQIEYRCVYEGEKIEHCSTSSYTEECIEGKDAILERYLKDGMAPIKSYTVCTKLYKKKCFDYIRFPIGQLYEDVVTNYDVLAKAKKYAISNKYGYNYFVRTGSITKGQFNLRDLDYILAGEQIAERTKGNSRLEKYGLMTLARFHFMCVCKMMKYKCADNVDWEKQIDTSVPVMRKGIPELLKSSMKLNRKVVLIAICFNTRITKAIVKHVNS